MRSLLLVVRAGGLVAALLAAPAASADVPPLGCGCLRAERHVQVDPGCEGKAFGASCGPGRLCQSHGPYYVGCEQADRGAAPIEAPAEPDSGVRGLAVPPVWVALVGLWAVARRRLRR